MKMQISQNKTYKKVRRIKKFAVLAVLLVVSVTTVGCGKKSKTEIVITTGLNSKELFKVSGDPCSIDDAKIILSMMQKQYADVFGDNNWDKEFGENGTLFDYLKEQTVIQLSQIKSMRLMAEKNDIKLNDSDITNIDQAADEYCSYFSEDSIKEYGIKKNQIVSLMQDYVLSKRLYQDIIKGVNTEISDDEARIIIVQQIFMKKDSDSKESKNNSLNEKAYAIWEKANAGENFESLAKENSDDEQIQLTLSRGDKSETYEEAAFNLKKNEISKLIDTNEGLYIIKCISNYEQTETEENKKVLYEKRCNELFNKKYDKFMEDKSREFNDKAWDKVKPEKTKDFPKENIWEIVEKHVSLS